MSDSIAIVCRRKSVKHCSICGYLGSYLCDYPLKNHGKTVTCDRPLCARCRVSIREGIDFCPPHARLYASQQNAHREVEWLEP